MRMALTCQWRTNAGLTQYLAIHSKAGKAVYRQQER
jgi:hypothetical protein